MKREHPQQEVYEEQRHPFTQVLLEVFVHATLYYFRGICVTFKSTTI